MASRSTHRVVCLYDVLEVPRTVSQDDLKKAYRRLALRWQSDALLHPPSGRMRCASLTVR